jgi:sporulation protein YlmC with PRC-barrel domain
MISKFFVGIEYLGDVSEESIVLSIDPVTELVGKKVFDADGRNLGKVVKLNRRSAENDFESLIVKKRIYSKGIVIPKKEIDTAKKNIILNKVYAN